MLSSTSPSQRALQEANIPLSAATKMLGCMYGPTHTEMLEADFEQTHTLGISTSCTLQFAGDTVAVRDGGKWVKAPAGGRGGGDDDDAPELQDFKDALCAAYAALNRGRLPPQCRAAVASA